MQLISEPNDLHKHSTMQAVMCTERQRRNRYGMIVVVCGKLLDLSLLYMQVVDGRDAHRGSCVVLNTM